MSTATMTHLFGLPEAIEKLVFPSFSRSNDGNESRGALPVDILETSKEYIFHLDIPGITKSDIQVTVEDERTLVVKSNGKRKREEEGDGNGEGCKYIRLERRNPHNVSRKFRLPEDANTAAISAKYEDGVLTVAVEKLPLPPPPKPKTIQVSVS